MTYLSGIDVGSTVKVKYLGLDKKDRMDFSIKDAQDLSASMIERAPVEPKPDQPHNRPFRRPVQHRED